MPVRTDPPPGSCRTGFGKFFLRWFQPVILFGSLLFGYFAPSGYATPAVVMAYGFALRAVCLVLERYSERHASWRLTWRELVTDLFFVYLVYHAWLIAKPLVYLARIIGVYAKSSASSAGGEVVLGPSANAVNHGSSIFLDLPIFMASVLIVIFTIDLGQYVLHRAMHKWFPLWLLHAPHHFVTQLNTLKEAVGNLIPVYLANIVGIAASLFVSRAYGFDNRVSTAASTVAISIGVYAHANIRFYSPGWWTYLFNTVEHHSLHHSRGRRAAECNYATNLIIIDRIFGTFREGEAELVGQEGGRRMSFFEQMTYPFPRLLTWAKALWQRHLPGAG